LVSESWLVAPSGCTSKSPITNCAETRGDTFDNSSSTSWQVISDGDAFTLGKEDNLLGKATASDQRAGMYGYDSLALTTASGAGVTQDDQVLAQVTTDQFWLGVLGLNPGAPGVAGQTRPSLLKSLLNDDKIPSLSYSYTAGASSSKPRPRAPVLPC
jgi:hypothetical protein